MKDIITKKTAIKFVRDYGKKIIYHYQGGCSHLELDHVEANGSYIWGRSQDTGTWLILAEVHENTVVWLDTKNVKVPYFGNTTYY